VKPTFAYFIKIIISIHFLFILFYFTEWMDFLILDKFKVLLSINHLLFKGIFKLTNTYCTHMAENS